jgi:heme-degrading monooxygenase HmoA
MFMRTVKMYIKLDEIEDFREAYKEKILSAFSKINGCRSAFLMQSTQTPEECVSLTFWKSDQDAHAFEESGRYEQLVKFLSPHFSESYELQIRLTKDLKLEYSSSKEPEIRRFEVASHHDSKNSGETHVRMVSLKFKEGMVSEFKKHYQEKVIPVLRSVHGCKTAFLAAPADNPNELISVTEWETEDAAQAYEHGGQFDQILESQRHFFSALYDWGMKRQKQTGSKVATSDDVSVDHHNVLVGRTFRQHHK